MAVAAASGALAVESLLEFVSRGRARVEEKHGSPDLPLFSLSERKSVFAEVSG